MPEESNLETFPSRGDVSIDRYDYWVELRRRDEAWHKKFVEELKHLFEHEIKLAAEWRQIGYAEQLRRIKKKVLG